MRPGSKRAVAGSTKLLLHRLDNPVFEQLGPCFLYFPYSLLLVAKAIAIKCPGEQTC